MCGPVDWCQVLLNTLDLASMIAVTPHGTYHAFDSRAAQGPGLVDRPLLILHGMFTAASSMVCCVCLCLCMCVRECACVHVVCFVCKCKC